MSEALWWEAAASLQSDLDARVREEAHEVFVAEASRSRMIDRSGPIRVVLRCGRVVNGIVAPSNRHPDGVLAIRDEAGDLLLVPIEAVLLACGSRPGLRDEDSPLPSLASVLRETWSIGLPVRLLLADGRWLAGVLAFVGSDHVDLRTVDDSFSVPFVAVEAWSLGEVGYP